MTNEGRNGNGKPQNTCQRIYKYFAVVLIGSAVVLAVILVPEGIPFWHFSRDNATSLLSALLLMSIFIERATEVIIKGWRGEKKQELVATIKSEKKRSKQSAGGQQRVFSELELKAAEELDNYKAETRTMALLTGFVLGVIVSALGVRAIQPIIDPAVFAGLSRTQAALLVGTDTLITGALIGGGSEGMHKILDAVLTRVDWYRDRFKPESADN